jgi:hypothetical protein
MAGYSEVIGDIADGRAEGRTKETGTRGIFARMASSLGRRFEALVVPDMTGPAREKRSFEPHGRVTPPSERVGRFPWL